MACDSADAGAVEAPGAARSAGLGTVGGNANAGTLTYNLGGLRRRPRPQARRPTSCSGVTVGFSGGTQWVQGFQGQGTTGTVQAGLYGSYARPFYVDGLAAYAYSDNQMTRQIAIPGIAASTARGQTGVNQVFGQVETGYRFDIGGLAQAYRDAVRPPAGGDGNANRFHRERRRRARPQRRGADHQLAAHGVRRPARGCDGSRLARRLRDAVPAGAGATSSPTPPARSRPRSWARRPHPSRPSGAAPQRDSVVLGLAANTAIADATSAYLRYEGDISYQNAATR